MPAFSTPRPRPAGGGGSPPGALPRPPPRRRGGPRRAPRPRPRAGPAAAGRGAATSTPRRRRGAAGAALALGLALGLPLLLLPLAGGPAGAAAQAPVQPPAPLPPALAAGPRAPEGEANGRAKNLPACATVYVSSGDRGTCKAKKRGKVLLVKDPVVTVLKDGEEEPAPLSPNRFVKQFAETYSPGAGPTADATIAGEAAVALALDGLGFKKSKAGAGKLKGKVDPSDREALAALDPAAGPCVLEFRTPCGEDGEDGEEGEGGGCTYANTTCAVGATCPGGTAVSAACADRSGFGENPCACTALEQLAALSTELQAAAPWNALASEAYCQPGRLIVDCTPVDGVQLPTYVSVRIAGLAGALPPSLGELGSSLTGLDLADNAITSLPTEIAALTGLWSLVLFDNQLTGVPAEFRTVDPFQCYLDHNDPDFSCANVGFGTSCCNDKAPNNNCPGGTSTCYGFPCSYSDTTCPVGAICPGGTAVSAACADRSGFNENPCACTALQELAALSDDLQAEAPWDDLANAAYCQTGSGLQVRCKPVGGVQLPADVDGSYTDLAGALPPSLGELGSSLMYLDLFDNAITSVPTEIAALTVLEVLNLAFNQLPGVPTDFSTVDPSDACVLYDNPAFSCANVGFGTSCCTDNNCPGGTSTCSTCTYANTTCAVGATCPGGTAVSAACADRSGFGENPCACTALEQLAALSTELQAAAPWDDLATAAYCQAGSLEVDCATAGGVQLPTDVNGLDIGLAGALPPSLGELGPSLTSLGLGENAITSVPTEIGALTGLTALYLQDNQLTGVPAEFRTVNPSWGCFLYDNPAFSCANVGFGTSCCTADNCPAGTSTCSPG